MDERIETTGGWATDVRPASPSETRRMADAEALARIDEMREAARVELAAGNRLNARALYVSACDIAETNYLGIDVIKEYAGVMGDLGFPEYEQAYLQRHQELADMLERYKVPRQYEERLRAERTAPTREDVPEATPARGQERIGEVASQAREASGGLGHEVPSSTRQRPAERG